MGMRKRIAKGVAYAKAPKATLSVLHPRKAASAKAISWVADRMMPARRRRSRRKALTTGLGAAAVTIPLGIWLGRQLRHDREAPAQFGTA